MFGNQTRILGLLLCLLSQGQPALCETITASEYLPLEDGNFWTYRVTESGDTFTETVTVVPGTTLIDGVPTKAVRDTDGETEFLTSDANGIKLYRFEFPADGETVNFNPPVVLAPPTFELPSEISGSGTAEFIIAGAGIFILDYTSSTSLSGKETITVPAGTYETIKTVSILHATGTVQGQPFDVTLTTTTWFAKDVGEVKYIEINPDTTLEAVLTRTNAGAPLSVVRPLPWLSPLLLP